jgi:arginyl-tRNA synthetase
MATNVALVLAKRIGKDPRALAEQIASRLGRQSTIERAEVAGPGFVNVTFSKEAFQSVLREVVTVGRAYGRAPAATGERILLEFVSANPTGPLLVSHGRGAVIGDVIGRLLEAAGHRVTREYYINDFGNQVRLLSESVIAAHDGQPPPDGGYGGWYVKELAEWFREHRPELVAKARNDESARSDVARQCVTLMLDGFEKASFTGIKKTLAELGVEFDVFTSEEGMHRWGRVERTLDALQKAGRLEEKDGALMFVTGDEDDKDRVVRKRDGAFTYFSSDIAYHDDKIARGFERLIDVWGADHHGYVARVKVALSALGHDPSRLEVLLFQLVKLLRDGKPVKMGKRLGNLITIQEVVEEIDEAVGNPNAGRDALRYFYLSRRVDTPIELDVELAKRQKSENPVFYVQYGHARLCAIQRRAKETFGLGTPRYSDAAARRVEHPLELALLARLGRYPAVVADAAAAREPQKIVQYLRDIAQDFQSYYTQLSQEGDSILPRTRDMTGDWESRWDKEKTLGRLLWVDAILTVYRSGLGMLGIDAPERMARAEAEGAGVDEA